jgi:hypothetical protein
MQQLLEREMYARYDLEVRRGPLGDGESRDAQVPGVAVRRGSPRLGWPTDCTRARVPAAREAGGAEPVEELASRIEVPAETVCAWVHCARR